MIVFHFVVCASQPRDVLARALYALHTTIKSNFGWKKMAWMADTSNIALYVKISEFRWIKMNTSFVRMTSFSLHYFSARISGDWLQFFVQFLVFISFAKIRCQLLRNPKIFRKITIGPICRMNATKKKTEAVTARCLFVEQTRACWASQLPIVKKLYNVHSDQIKNHADFIRHWMLTCCKVQSLPWRMVIFYSAFLSSITIILMHVIDSENCWHLSSFAFVQILHRMMSFQS